MTKGGREAVLNGSGVVVLESRSSRSFLLLLSDKGQRLPAQENEEGVRQAKISDLCLPVQARM